MGAGCSLAESITAQDVRALREAYPGVPIVTYVNTSAAVKAESDVCCTSSNAVKIVNGMGSDRVLCIPDEYLAQNVAREADVEVIAWKGRCEVHDSPQKNCSNIAKMIGSENYRPSGMQTRCVGRSRFLRLNLGND